MWHSERKAALQAGIQALLKAQRKKDLPEFKPNAHPYTTQLTAPQRNRPKGHGSKIPTRKPPPTRKGFLLPYKVNANKQLPLGPATPTCPLPWMQKLKSLLQRTQSRQMLSLKLKVSQDVALHVSPTTSIFPYFIISSKSIQFHSLKDLCPLFPCGKSG